MLLRTSTLFRATSAALCFGHRGACAIPHPSKVHRGGEDAYLAHPCAIGVADGVGGYASAGIDPAIYTRNVMRYTLAAVEADVTEGHSSTALDALHRGYIKAEASGEEGGCPVTLATILEGRCASILNLGDCGIVVVRDDQLLFRTEVQQHRFNCPYQLPSDPPSAGQEAKLELRVGDTFLCTSDGVLDNVELNQLLQHLKEVNAKGCTSVATAIGKEAFRNGKDRTYFSPFARHAAETGHRYMGGKLDDITALVAQVTLDDVEGTGNCPPLITMLLGMEERGKEL